MSASLALPKQLPERLLHLPDLHDLDAAFRGVEAAEVAVRHEDTGESQLFGLEDALLDAVHGADFPAEAHFSGHARARLDGDVEARREDGGEDGEVDGGIVHAQAAGDVEEDILLDELEAGTFLEHGQQHIHAAEVETGRATLGRPVNGTADKALRFNQEGAHPFDGGGDSDTAEALVVLGQKQLGRVADLAQTLAAHLVDAEFRGAPEAVLDAAEDAVHVMLVALELQHGIDDVLQDFRAGDAALLIDVADEQDGHPVFLGKTEDGGAALANLRDAAGRGLDQLREDCLDGVDNHQVGLDGAGVLEDIFQVRLAEDVERVRCRGAEAVGAEFELSATLLARDVEDAQVREFQDRLEDEGRFADARFAANQDERAAHQATAEDTVQLGVVEVEPVLLLSRDVAQADGAHLLPGCGKTRRGAGLRGRVFRNDFFYISIPFPAVRTFAEPFRGVCPAVGADVNSFCFSHKDLYDLLVPDRTGSRAHFEFDGSATHNQVVGEVTFLIRLAVHLDRLDVDVLTTDGGSQDGEGLAIRQLQLDAGEHRRANLVLAANRVHGIEAHRAEDVPGRHLAAVLVSAETAGLVGVQLVHHLGGILLRLPRLLHLVVEVDDVVARLVAVGVLANHAGAEDRKLFVRIGGVSKHAVELLGEAFLATDQADEVVDVMLDGPEVLPAVALADVFGVSFGLEILGEVALLVARLHERRGGVEDVAVVLRTLVELLGDVGFAHLFRHASDAIVVVGILQRLGHRPALP